MVMAVAYAFPDHGFVAGLVVNLFDSLLANHLVHVVLPDIRGYFKVSDSALAKSGQDIFHSSVAPIHGGRDYLVEDSVGLKLTIKLSRLGACPVVGMCVIVGAVSD
jgi:hypothetical protein